MGGGGGGEETAVFLSIGTVGSLTPVVKREVLWSRIDPHDLRGVPGPQAHHAPQTPPPPPPPPPRSRPPAVLILIPALLRHRPIIALRAAAIIEALFPEEHRQHRARDGTLEARQHPRESRGRHRGDVLGDLVLGSHLRQFMQRFDLLVTPSVAVPAFEARPAGHTPMDPAAMLGWMPFSYPFNLTQQPACTIPCGLTPEGLPIGLQIVGPMFEDALVLRAARAYETTRPLLRPPAVPTAKAI